MLTPNILTSQKGFFNYFFLNLYRWFSLIVNIWLHPWLESFFRGQTEQKLCRTCHLVESAIKNVYFIVLKAYCDVKSLSGQLNLVFTL